MNLDVLFFLFRLKFCIYALVRDFSMCIKDGVL